MIDDQVLEVIRKYPKGVHVSQIREELREGDPRDSAFVVHTAVNGLLHSKAIRAVGHLLVANSEVTAPMASLSP